LTRNFFSSQKNEFGAIAGNDVDDGRAPPSGDIFARDALATQRDAAEDFADAEALSVQGLDVARVVGEQFAERSQPRIRRLGRRRHVTGRAESKKRDLELFGRTEDFLLGLVVLGDEESEGSAEVDGDF
jgi:hypothetical protein